MLPWKKHRAQVRAVRAGERLARAYFRKLAKNDPRDEMRLTEIELAALLALCAEQVAVEYEEEA